MDNDVDKSAINLLAIENRLMDYLANRGVFIDKFPFTDESLIIWDTVNQHGHDIHVSFVNRKAGVITRYVNRQTGVRLVVSGQGKIDTTKGCKTVKQLLEPSVGILIGANLLLKTQQDVDKYLGGFSKHSSLFTAVSTVLHRTFRAPIDGVDDIEQYTKKLKAGLWQYFLTQAVGRIEELKWDI